jgi:hypothetical protein
MIGHKKAFFNIKAENTHAEKTDRKTDCQFGRFFFVA